MLVNRIYSIALQQRCGDDRSDDRAAISASWLLLWDWRERPGRHKLHDVDYIITDENQAVQSRSL